MLNALSSLAQMTPSLTASCRLLPSGPDATKLGVAVRCLALPGALRGRQLHRNHGRAGAGAGPGHRQLQAREAAFAAPME